MRIYKYCMWSQRDHLHDLSISNKRSFMLKSRRAEADNMKIIVRFLRCPNAEVYHSLYHIFEGGYLLNGEWSYTVSFSLYNFVRYNWNSMDMIRNSLLSSVKWEANSLTVIQDGLLHSINTNANLIEPTTTRNMATKQILDIRDSVDLSSMAMTGPDRMCFSIQFTW